MPITEGYKLAWKQVLRGDPCSYCGETGGQVDHIEPANRGVYRQCWGSRYLRWGILEQPENWAGVCARCNNRKGNLRLLDFLVLKHKRGW